MSRRIKHHQMSLKIEGTHLPAFGWRFTEEVVYHIKFLLFHNYKALFFSVFAIHLWWPLDKKCIQMIYPVKETTQKKTSMKWSIITVLEKYAKFTKSLTMFTIHLREASQTQTEWRSGVGRDWAQNQDPPFPGLTWWPFSVSAIQLQYGDNILQLFLHNMKCFEHSKISIYIITILLQSLQESLQV